MTRDAVFGHVYVCAGEGDGENPDWIPGSDEIILKISERYRQWKALSST